MSNNTILKALERMGYKGSMTGHGFRGLASTLLHEQGYRHDYIELQLAHAPRNAVSAAYNHALYLEPRSRMMQDWADFLERTQRGGKVLPFRDLWHSHSVNSAGRESGHALQSNPRRMPSRNPAPDLILTTTDSRQYVWPPDFSAGLDLAVN